VNTKKIFGVNRRLDWESRDDMNKNQIVSNRCYSANEVFPLKGYFSKLGAHRTMLGDTQRTLAFQKAIETIVKPGDVVADLGTGTGILAMFAAKKGAKKVYAVESGPIISLAKKIAAKNNLVSRIEFIRGNSRAISLPQKVDVIVSETIGLAGFEENIVETMADFQKRFGKKTTQFIPRKLELFVALSDYMPAYKLATFWRRKLYGFSFSPLLELSLQNLYSRIVAPKSSIVSRAQKIACFNLGKDQVAETSREVVFKIGGSTRICGFWFWFRLFLTDSIIICSSPFDSTTHWQNCFIPLSQLVNLIRNDIVKVKFKLGSTNKGQTFFSWRTTIARKGNVINSFSQSTRKIIDYITH